jgi:tRNA G18 (ribose-2'-O)-methylase SpoU
MSGIFHTTVYTITEEELDVLSGVPLITADLDGENIFTFTPPEKFCLCIGNEGHGLSEGVKKRANYTVTIPMRKTQESLNAGVSAGIAMYLLKKGTFAE